MGNNLKFKYERQLTTNQGLISLQLEKSQDFVKPISEIHHINGLEKKKKYDCIREKSHV